VSAAVSIYPLVPLSTLILYIYIYIYIYIHTYICRYAVRIPGGAVSGSVTVVLSVFKLGALG
jgi:hypothetical protein